MTAARDLGELGNNVSVTTTGLINIDSGTLYIDGVNNTVGIGTSTISGGRLAVSGIIQGMSVGAEGGEINLLNPGNSTTGLTLDVSVADTPRLFSVRNNMSMQIGQLSGTGGQIGFFTVNSERMRLEAGGNTVIFGNCLPNTTNTVDLGSAAQRWRNIYTQDLHLSNGIGDWTVVEGEENLYIVNNKSGKSFKFALIEVDPAEVPPKSTG